MKSTVGLVFYLIAIGGVMVPGASFFNEPWWLVVPALLIIAWAARELWVQLSLPTNDEP